MDQRPFTVEDAREKEEKFSSSNSSDYRYKKNNKTLYVVNFTPKRLVLFMASSFSLIVLVFIMGFYIGNANMETSKENTSSLSLLLPEDPNTLTSSSVPGIGKDVDNSLTPSGGPSSLDIIDRVTLNRPGDESVTVEKINPEYYNDYTDKATKDLNSSFEKITKPNMSYMPQVEKMYPKPDPPPPLEFSSKDNNSGSIITKEPYNKYSSDKNLIFFIQVAVGYNRDFTYGELRELKQEYANAFIMEEATKNGTMYKLKIGRFNTRVEAEKVLSEVKRKYKDSYIYTDKK